MRGRALTTDEIKQRIARGRNYERLYHALKPEYDHAMERIAELEAVLAKQTEGMQTQAARIEQLETVVFGRKPKLPRQPKLRLAAKRDSLSYRRPIPPASTITAEAQFSIKLCRRCGHTLTDKTEATRYEEDIELAVLNPKLPAKKVTRQTVEQGWCSRCGQYSSALDLRGQNVTLGPVVRSYVTYLCCQAELSYAQIQELLLQQHDLYLASSEITAILAERRVAYLPQYEQLKARIRAGPAHVDETRYPLQSEHGAGYAHVMASAATDDVVFKLADSRGKGNSKQLVGEDYQGVGITDRYAGYKQLFAEGHHQICWAHLARNAGDIARLECLDDHVRKHCRQFYQGLSQLYATVRTYRREPFHRSVRETQARHLLQEVQALCQPLASDPKQLSGLKAGILEYQNCLFICLTEPNVPPDNNKAERNIRKLVLKRKKSFGVKTMKGARTMEVLHSVCQSLANRDKPNVLRNLYQLAAA